MRVSHWLAASLCLLVVGCGGAGTSAERLAGSEELQAVYDDFAACLRTNGVDWPDPEWEGGAIVNWRPEDIGVDIADAGVQRAGAACSASTGFDPMLAHALRDESS